MRSWRRAHAIVLAGITATVTAAVAQPFGARPLAPPPEVPEAGSGSGSAIVRPAGSSPVESSDLPDLQTTPPRFAVTPFENRANVRAFDWLVAGAPFEIAEKTEGVLGLETTGGPLYVGGVLVEDTPRSVAAFAAQTGASYVVTGWVQRPNWELELAISLWQVKGGAASVVKEARVRGPVPTYHKLLGDAVRQVWTAAGWKIDDAKGEKLARPLASDIYAVTLLGRGLGHFTGALTPSTPADPVAAAAFRAKQLELAAHDLERAVFIDPKCFEAQRAAGELYKQLGEQNRDPKLVAKANGKFAYANDLAPDDIGSLRAAAQAAADGGKHDLALMLFRRLVMLRPWELEARYELGAAMWHTGDASGAEHQLEQVTARKPDHLAARRVLVLIHASRSDTAKLVGELEAIAARAPNDLEVKGELASGYAAMGKWDRSTAALEAIAAARAPDLPLLVRVGDGHRRMNDLDGALAWYAKAAKQAPESSLPGFAMAQALVDAGKLTEATRIYTNLQKFKDDLAAAEQALGSIALIQGRPDDAAWYLRKSVKDGPRSLPAWRALIAAELARKDGTLALTEIERARVAWANDGILAYQAAAAHVLANERDLARAELRRAIAAAPDLAAAKAAQTALESGGTFSFAYTPEIVRPWADAEGLQQALDRYGLTAQAMAAVRASYQGQVLALLGALGKGPQAPVKQPPPRNCPIGRVAPLWAQAQDGLRRYERLGVDLEAGYRFIERHADAGATGGLLPAGQQALVDAKKTFRISLADIGELRAEWLRGAGSELRAVGCSDKLLEAAVKNPDAYRVIVEDRPDEVPKQAPPRSRPRATFYVDNTRCPDPVDVWVDGAQIGSVSPGRRSALIADGGDRSLCLLGPGSAQCGDRGTTRQVYLHDGWSVTLYCPK